MSSSEAPRYTLWRALAETQGSLALMMTGAAILCLFLAAIRVPVPVNAAVTAGFGPGNYAVAVILRWRRLR
jgi:hypothetical protein